MKISTSLSLVSELVMAPQTHSERITALESQITGVMTAIDEIRSVATRSEQTLLEATAKNDKN
ncbi:hypothetical protein F2Q69_00008340 [Brassica cretica]|uniref:Uncharacterized protein n=1 Tax=Brassica cretica TaxID=69181 RepID=A0A8S9NX22_BRACR|nr:hypothetical protein F2Q69_00008340 [Brassica cretica]